MINFLIGFFGTFAMFGFGFVAGRWTSGAAQLRAGLSKVSAKLAEAAEDAALLGARCKELDASLAKLEAGKATFESTIRKLGRRIAEMVAENRALATEIARRNAPLIAANAKRHAARLEREAAERAKTTALHETMRNERADVRELIA